MSNKRPPSFGRSGRPRKINFSDLFLWDPTIELELNGISLSDLLGDDNPEMLRLFRDLGRKRPISIERAKEVLPPILALVPTSLADHLRAALEAGDDYHGGVGKWGSFIYARSMKDVHDWPPKLSPLGRHFVDIEQALREPTLAWHQDDMVRCANLLEASSVLTPYLWPEVIAKIRGATTEAEVTAARGMVMLELYLSCLACWDAQLQAKGYAKASIFEVLFPDFSSAKIKQPNTLFFAWLAAHSGAKSQLANHIHQISKPARDTSIDSTKRQLRRWRNGSGFPSDATLDALYRSLLGEKARNGDDPRHKDWILSWSMATATRRISFLLPILIPLSKFREPSFPFGHQTVQEWRESRYPHWYRYWLPLLEKQT